MFIALGILDVCLLWGCPPCTLGFGLCAIACVWWDMLEHLGQSPSMEVVDFDIPDPIDRYRESTSDRERERKRCISDHLAILSV